MIFLRLKHWQIFCISWGPVSLFLIGVCAKPYLILGYTPIPLILFLVGLVNSFIWVWLIFVELRKISPNMNFSLFKVAFWIPCIYIFFIIAFILYGVLIRKVEGFNPEVEWIIIVGLAILSLLGIIFGLVFIGRLIKATELKQPPTVKQHLLESALMLFPPLGLWIIQPKLNRLVTHITNQNTILED